MRIVVMGVSGSGKSSVAEALALSLGLDFADADPLHPTANVEKMRAGIPLDDADRLPWLETVGRELARAPGGLVMACSALRRRYRDLIRQQAPDTVFVHVHGRPDLLRERLRQRTGHFMPPDLLTSQLNTLEPLQDDEPGGVISLDQPLDQEVAEARRLVGRHVSNEIR